MRFELLALAFAILLLAGCAGKPPAASAPQPPVEPPQMPSFPPENQSTACTEEAKLCPDGSYVGRNSSLNCEFDPCPTFQPRKLGAEGEFCGGIAAFQCEQGLECIYDGTYPDAGGTCMNLTNTSLPNPDQFTICPSDRPAACTKEYRPVCGRIMLPTGVEYYRDYPNSCTACSKDANAVGYWVGDCQSRDRT